MSRRSSAESPSPQAAQRRPQADGCKQTASPHAAAHSPIGEPCQVPVISGSRSSYYLFQQGGHRMAVALVDKGARLRVNDAIDVVVLEIYNGSVKIGLVERSRPTTSCEDSPRSSAVEP